MNSINKFRIDWRFVVAATFFLIPIAARPVSAQLIYQNDFDQHTAAGIYTDDDLDQDWDEPNFNNGVTEGRVSIVTGADAFGGTGSSLAVFYPAGERGPQKTGAQWKFRFDAEYDEVWLSYRIKFKNGFDFVRGGKLPGLAGGTAPTGSTPTTGFNGWTGRLMWRTDFQGVSGNPEQLTSNAISYAKHTMSGFNQDGAQEDRIYWYGADENIKVLESGRWYQITQKIKMNDPTVGNGVIRIWLDGELVHDQQDVVFRHTDALKIDQMYFSTFFGGGSAWATSKDETIYFDDFVISTPNTRYLKVPQNYSSVQTAIEAALPGDVVAVRQTQTENVFVDKPITLRGYNGTELVAPNSTEPAITVGFAGVTIKRIDVAGGLEGVRVLSNRENVKLDFVFAHGAQVGINVQDNCHGSTVRKCDAYDNVSEGILIVGSNDVTVKSNDTFDNGFHGISVLNSVGGSFTRNRSNNNGGDGFVVDASDFDISNNRARFNSGFGFFITQGDHTIISNVARENMLSGFKFQNSSNSQIITNRSIRNVGSGFVWSSQSNNNIVTSNTSLRNTTHGFRVDGSSGNFLSFGTSDDNENNGFFLTGTSSDNYVTENSASENGGSSLVDDGVDNIVDQNVFDD